MPHFRREGRVEPEGEEGMYEQDGEDRDFYRTLGIIVSGGGRIRQGVRPVFAWLP